MKYKAKLSFDKIRAVESNPVGKLILVTAINPTPAGEGKSTITIGLADALNKIGKKPWLSTANRLVQSWGSREVRKLAVVLCLGKLPMEDINLHFTGGYDAIANCQQCSLLLWSTNYSLKIQAKWVGNWTNVVSFGNVSWDLWMTAFSSCDCWTWWTSKRYSTWDGFWYYSCPSEIMAILAWRLILKILKSFSKYRYRLSLPTLPPVWLVTAGVGRCAEALIRSDAIAELVQTIYGTPALYTVALCQYCSWM